MKTRVDQGSAFISVRRTHCADAVGKVVQNSGVKSHNSFGTDERYHGPLRLFKKTILEDLKIDRKRSLQLTVKAMNDLWDVTGLCIPT